MNAELIRDDGIRKAIAWFRKKHYKNAPEITDEAIMDIIGLLALTQPNQVSSWLYSMAKYRLLENFETDLEVILARIAQPKEYQRIKLESKK